MKIGNGDANEVRWELFLHGRVAGEQRQLLPRAEEPNNRKGTKIAESIVATVIAGAESAWRVRYDLAAAAGIVGMALGRKMRLAAKVCLAA